MRSRFFNLATVLFIGDMLLTQVALLLSAAMRYAIPLGKTIEPADPNVILYTPLLHVIALCIWPSVFVSLNVYDSRRLSQPIYQVRALIPAALAATFVFAGTLYFSFRDVPRVMVVYLFFVDLVILALFRLVLALLTRFRRARGRNVLRVLIVGANETGDAVAQALRTELGQHSVWTGFVDDTSSPDATPVLGTVSQTPELVERHAVDEVIIAIPSSKYDCVEPLLQDLQTLPVHVSVVPDLFRLAMVRASVDHIAGIPLIGIREPLIQGADRMIKRTFDLLCSGIALLVTAPLLASIAVAVNLDSSGPVLFKQRRVGENGRLFWMYKFRTMTEGCDQPDVCEYVPDESGTLRPVYKQPNDPRVTRVGRMLRRLSLDELPQLFNVIMGEMSLVGPRPEQLFIVEQYEPWQRQRLVVPPGITGWWQVSGRSDLPMHMNTEYDLFYIRNYSLWLDLVILWRTAGTVIVGRGAY